MAPFANYVCLIFVVFFCRCFSFVSPVFGARSWSSRQQALSSPQQQIFWLNLFLKENLKKTNFKYYEFCLVIESWAPMTILWCTWYHVIMTLSGHVYSQYIPDSGRYSVCCNYPNIKLVLYIFWQQISHSTNTFTAWKFHRTLPSYYLSEVNPYHNLIMRRAV